MAPTRLDEAAGLTVADVMHAKFSALPASATIDDVREWFTASSHRQMAFLADGERYAGSILRDELGDDLDAARPAAEIALDGPTVAPDDPASRAEELALQSEARRVPVVDRDGRLLGTVAVTPDLQRFCGT
jgi:CBS domain-containing protein